MAVTRYFSGSGTSRPGSGPELRIRLLGSWPKDRVRRTRVHDRSALLLGECLATSGELREALSHGGPLHETAARTAALRGSYCVVVSHGTETAVATDLAGLHRVWYRSGPGGAEFASTPLALIRDPVRDLDADALAARLFCPDFHTGLFGGSLYKGVTEVPPDRVLLLNDGRAVLGPRAVRRGRASFREGAHALREALDTGVRARVADARTVTADLSGGMDSSTLALLAARHRDDPLPALTYTDPFAANDDDVGYAALLAAGNSGLDQVIVEGDAASLPFTGMDGVPITDHPSLDAVILVRDRVRLRPASGVSVHLAGDGGDAVLGAPLTYLAALAGQVDPRPFAREARGWARLRHRPTHRVAKAAWAARRVTYADALNVQAADLEASPSPQGPENFSKVEHAIAWTRTAPAARWGTERARDAVASRLRRAAEDAHGSEGVDAHALRVIRRHASDTRLFVDIAAHLGVRMAVPFFDNQVVAACLAVPSVERVSVLRAKPLLKAAFSGDLPAELYARRTKGDYGACEYHGIRRNAARLRHLLGESRLADLGVLQPRLALAELDRAIGGGYAAMAGICDVVAAEVWLRGLEHGPALLPESTLTPQGDR
ncbi:albusnodin/ikarugamycin family macrolactam cyclase [Nocardiopsis quinghaiensis]|uniref:albusnodin/ikarugamycin family macrolactam cyclase n=1 Tax=Nocardiopsis quinghaiensis TaxID=464995 RepID=UPI001CC23441|nr:albusnodin/ikarugamycin family macrolactam cyclase [Nocardiopsis quinghaiensis]